MESISVSSTIVEESIENGVPYEELTVGVVKEGTTGEMRCVDKGFACILRVIDKKMPILGHIQELLLDPGYMTIPSTDGFGVLCHYGPWTRGFIVQQGMSPL